MCPSYPQNYFEPRNLRFRSVRVGSAMVHVDEKLKQISASGQHRVRIQHQTLTATHCEEVFLPVVSCRMR